ncbi:MAG TPA: sigma-70 family RNA polymerase sigma factor [Anaeromyxobacter sp.]|nr:sigma-70 family RNA polymerase sigma factor [Anaeromyxobacter sp.]
MVNGAALARTTFQGTDEALVGEVLAGSPSRFGLLVHRHERRLRSLARHLLWDREEVEDVVQQTFVQAFVALDRFAGTGPFSTWLTRIAVNEARLRARRWRRTERSMVELSQSSESVADTPEQKAGRRETVERVRVALDRLPARHREVLSLVVDGLSHEEIAERLGIRAGAVKVRVHRARAALRQKVSQVGRVILKGTPRLALAPHHAAHIGSSSREALRSG